MSSHLLSSKMRLDALRHYLKPLTLLACMMCLSACSVFQTDRPKEEAAMSRAGHFEWNSLKVKLAQLNSWELMGKIGIRTQEDSVTAAIHRWTQVDEQFNIDLSSTFFGFGASNISGNTRAIVLTEAGEPPAYSEQPDQLIEEALGIPLPLTYLPYWIKGLPVPGANYDISFDARGLPTRIEQFGWILEPSKYQLHTELPLPGKIKMTSEGATITLAIKRWTLI